jgi:hypothetical protein
LEGGEAEGWEREEKEEIRAEVARDRILYFS